MSDSISVIPQNLPISKSTAALLRLNGVVIVLALLIWMPLIKLALVVPILEGKGIISSDPRVIWAISFLTLSLTALFSLWRCRRPSRRWCVTSTVCLAGLLIHGLTFTSLGEGWLVDWLSNPDNRIVIAFSMVRILLGILLALDFSKNLKIQNKLKCEAI